MSRKPSTSRTGIPRTASQASIAMPPPNRIPSGSGNGGSAARPASQMSSGNGDPSSRAPSPRKTSVSKRNGVVPASGKSASEGETNIQVVVRCR